MPGEPLLLAIATVAVVVAGFTAVTATLVPPGGSWHPAMRIRQRAIVSTSFNGERSIIANTSPTRRSGDTVIGS